MNEMRHRYNNVLNLLTLQFGIVVIGGCVVGLMVTHVAALTTGVLAAGLVGAVLIFHMPLLGLLLLMAFSFVSTSYLPVLFELGEFSFRVHDPIFFVLFLVLLERVFRSSPKVYKSTIAAIIPLAVFFGYIGLTLFRVYAQHPSSFGIAAASYFRLCQYALLVPIACLTLRTEAQLRRLLRFLATCSVLSLPIAAYEFSMAEGGFWAERTGSLLVVNAFGLVSGLLFLFGWIGRRQLALRIRSFAWLFIIAGALGLLFSKSIGSNLATAVSVGLYELAHLRRDILLPARLVGAAVVAFSVLTVVIFSLRSNDALGLVAVREGSMVQRLIMAKAGIEIFTDQPLMGVGWQASSFPEVIGTSELGRVLRAAFVEVPDHYFPDLRPLSVHNFYVQILAELGIVGVVLFLWMVVFVGFLVSRIVRKLPEKSPLKAYGTFMMMVLVFLLTWWNTNPLYGGQVETFLAFTFWGALLALPKIAEDAKDRLVKGNAGQ